MLIRINGKDCATIGDVEKYASPMAAAFVEEWFDDKEYVVGHTSGSTGKPKEIRLLKSDMRHSARMTNRFFGLTTESRMLLCLSPSYIAGKMMLVRAMECGAGIWEEMPSNNPLQGYSGIPFDFVAMVPSQVSGMIDDDERLQRVRMLIIGGGVIPRNLHDKIVGCGINAYATYGMTETCSHVALSKIGRSCSIFEALPSVSFDVDERGCLVINAPDFSFRRLVTNDIVKLVSPTRFYWLGRYDNVINTGGIKVYPEEIEKKIETLLPYRFYVSSKRSDKWGDEVVVVVECDGMGRDEQDNLMEKMKSILPKYSVPKEIVCIPHFNETSSGKVKRDYRG